MNNGHMQCRESGCQGKCCQIKPITLSEAEYKMLSNGKNRVSNDGINYFMTWEGKWCGYSNFDLKTCELGDDKPADTFLLLIPD